MALVLWCGRSCRRFFSRPLRFTAQCFSLLLVLIFLISSSHAAAQTGTVPTKPSTAATKIALLHLDVSLGRLDDNMAQVERGIRQAGEAGANWVMTPELSLTGYRFEPMLSLDTLRQRNPHILNHFKQLSTELGVVIFLSHVDWRPDRQLVSDVNADGGQQPSRSGSFYNTLFVIAQGAVIARHDKINVIPVVESWATAGDKGTLVSVDGIEVGLLICADAWPQTTAANLANRGAQIILSSANWWPGEYGPGKTWESRSGETGLPLVVNNRTGIEARFDQHGNSLPAIDMRMATSVYVEQGRRLVDHQTPGSSMVMLQWQASTGQLLDWSAFSLRGQPN